MHLHIARSSQRVLAHPSAAPRRFAKSQDRAVSFREKWRDRDVSLSRQGAVFLPYIYIYIYIYREREI